MTIRQTGRVVLIAELLVATCDFLPLLAVLLLFYIVTGLLANHIAAVVTVMLMIHVVVDAAIRSDANGFAFLLAMMFASVILFMRPIGTRQTCWSTVLAAASPPTS